MRGSSGSTGIARRHGCTILATNDVHYHAPDKRPLQDVMTCIREKVTLPAAGYLLNPNAERHLKSPEEMVRLFARWPHAISATREFADALHFSLNELKYEYPRETVPEGRTPQEHLDHLTREGARKYWPDGVPAKVQEQLKKELEIIAKLDFARYFLTVHDIVAFARSQAILCQGRGSAANSAVCFCLGITGVDPATSDLLFERFISEERREPPDIDVDFEHERREEVIQHIYDKYGRDRAGIAATVIHYRPRSAIREVGKVMGLSEDVTAALASTIWGSWGEDIVEERADEAGLDLSDPHLKRTIKLAQQLIGMPRHLSQHVGGFILTERPLTETVPIGNGAMEDRTFIEWDKDDIDDLGILKIDVLALGMLTCIRKCFDLIEQHQGARWELATVPQGERRVYDMLCQRRFDRRVPGRKPRADGHAAAAQASQILRPGDPGRDRPSRTDPGRHGTSLSEAPRGQGGGRPSRPPRPTWAARRTRANSQADFGRADLPGTGDEDRSGCGRVHVRRSQPATQGDGDLPFARDYLETRGKMVGRMIERGYDPEFAQRCFDQIKGFGEYGFPESHATTFAHLVYVSSWIKFHYPAAFAAALLNSQPMGFYAPAQIVRDARDHGVEVREIDVNHSDWDCTLEGPALRLGLRQVDGLQRQAVDRLMSGRCSRSYECVEDLRVRGAVPVPAIQRSPAADAFRSMASTGAPRFGMRERSCKRRTCRCSPRPNRDEGSERRSGKLPAMPLSEHVINDYQTIRLSLESPPDELPARALCRSASSPPILRNTGTAGDCPSPAWC